MWAFQDDDQELVPLETVLEIEHIYARNRYDKDKSLTDVKNLEALETRPCWKNASTFVPPITALRTKSNIIKDL